MTIAIPEFRAAMGSFPGAVTLVTTGSGADRSGITATAVCSVTDSPPSLLVCVNRATGTRHMIAETGLFSVHLLDSEHGPLARHFAGANGAKGAAKFDMGDWQSFASGLPLLADAAVSLACEVTETMEVGTHSLFIGRIEEVRLNERAPLVYAKSQFHGIAPLPAA